MNRDLDDLRARTARAIEEIEDAGYRLLMRGPETDAEHAAVASSVDLRHLLQDLIGERDREKRDADRLGAEVHTLKAQLGHAERERDEGAAFASGLMTQLTEAQADKERAEARGDAGAREVERQRAISRHNIDCAVRDASRAQSAEVERNAALKREGRLREALESVRNGDHNGCAKDANLLGVGECGECIIERALADEGRE